MPITLFHGIISYLLARKFFRDKNLLRLSFLGGLAPDLDAYPLLFGDLDLYRKIHHEWLHPPFFGLLFGLVFSGIFYIYCKKRKIKFNYSAGVLVFFSGHLLHSFTDIFTSDLAINFLYPLGNLYLGDVLNLQTHSAMLTLSIAISLVVIIASIYCYKKDKSTFSELLKT